MYFWYKTLTYLFYPFAPIYLYLRKIRNKEDPIRYKEKLSKINISRNEGFLVWFHVASVGEAMSILPLLDNCIEEEKIDKLGKLLLDNKLFFFPKKYVDAYLDGKINDEELIMGKGVFNWPMDFTLGTPDLAIEIAFGRDCKKKK